MEELSASAQRIYDPFAYRQILRERFVPISVAEAFGLAQRHPIAWRRNSQGDLQLVAIRGLNPEAEVPGIHTLPRDGLPLLLQAFPFRFRDVAVGDFEIGLDRSAPARERDSGSYVFDTQGTLLPGAELKLRALEEFRREAIVEAALLQSAFRHDLLEPVVLPEAIRSRYMLPDFVVVVSEPNDALLLQDLPKESWMTAMRFLTAQRLSLYQMARLITLAEAA